MRAEELLVSRNRVGNILSPLAKVVGFAVTYSLYIFFKFVVSIVVMKK